MAKNIKNDAASLSRFRASMYRVPCLIFYFKGNLKFNLLNKNIKISYLFIS